MEEAGWLQGCIFNNSVYALINDQLKCLPEGDDIWLIAASQSCDIANGREEYIEFSLARIIAKAEGNFCFNKNPRHLHLIAEADPSCGFANDQIVFDLLAHEKIQVNKEIISQDMQPETLVKLTAYNCTVYVDWLSARYKRPALPTEFNNRFKNNFRKSAEKVSEYVLGIYVEIFPDAEIAPEEIYNINLLALVKKETLDNATVMDGIKNLLNSYVVAMSNGNINVPDDQIFIKTEESISVSTFKKYKRFILDDLSYKSNDEQPPEKSFS